MQYKYLIMVTSEANNNKYYRMLQLNDSTFKVEYGRVGNSSVQTKEYPMSKWNSTYNSKIRKGYVDKTEIMSEVEIIKKKNSGYRDIPDSFIAQIVERLQMMAKNAIRDNYTVKSANVTKAMVNEAQWLLDKILFANNTVEEFNVILKELFTVIPRKMKKVADCLATSKEDFGNIIQREQDLLDVMSQQVAQNAIEDADVDSYDGDNSPKTILEVMGLIFEPCTTNDVAIIKKELADLSGNYVQSWKVTNIKTQERFDKFVKDNGIKDIRLLFHGSRNENWWGIITGGLVLRPNAVITGKLYGFGCYFAPKARKSYGYCSGGYWTGGNANNKFMALNSVAYGTPYDVYSFDSKYYNLNYNNLQNFKKGANCLHAHAGASLGGYNTLRNDEIIIYKEEQVTIKYLIELR